MAICSLTHEFTKHSSLPNWWPSGVHPSFVVSSAPTILRPWVHIPCTRDMVFWINIVEIETVIVIGMRNGRKEARIGPFLKKLMAPCLQISWSLNHLRQSRSGMKDQKQFVAQNYGFEEVSHRVDPSIASTYKNEICRLSPNLGQKRCHNSCYSLDPTSNMGLTSAVTSVTRLGNLLDFGQVFKAFGNN